MRLNRFKRTSSYSGASSKPCIARSRARISHRSSPITAAAANEFSRVLLGNEELHSE